ncbi:MAG: ClpXP protease specificity-enhancing factor [Gammaproteobacteria bacterium]|nr:MAG: ClpXP protease specificity-enhancing factor [Gammaproteobacteria bacterium]
MLSLKPYLLRAYYDWIVDSGMTPHIVVDANHADVQVPKMHIDDGKITLNIAPQAVQRFTMNSDTIVFSARFSGASFNVSTPIAAVLAIYARENKAGVVFQPEELLSDESHPEPPEPAPSRPALKVVK